MSFNKAQLKKLKTLDSLNIIMAKEESYKGKKIIIKENITEGENVLTINNKNIPFFKKSDEYFSPHLPYRTYSSLAELTQAIIDSLPRFRNGSVNPR